MTRKNSLHVLLVLLAVSGVLLILSKTNVLPSPFGGSARFQSSDPIESDSETTLSSESQHIGEPDDNDTQYPNLNATETDAVKQWMEFPIIGNDPDALDDAGESLRRWPAELSIPRLHHSDLNAIAAQSGDSRPLNGVTVILSAARGGEDTGVVLGKGADAVMEKTILLDLAEKTGDILIKRGATVVQTRTTDESCSYFAVVAKAADIALTRYRDLAIEAGYHPDPIDQLRLLMGDVIRINENSDASGGRGLFGTIGTPPQLRVLYDIEHQYTDILLIHLTLGFDEDDPSVSGAQAYYMSADFISDVNNGYAEGQDALNLPPNYTLIDSAGRANLALLLKSHLSRLEPRLRPVDGQESGKQVDLAVLRLSNFVSAVFEPGYLSNESDRSILTSDDGRANIAQAIANAICQYYAYPIR